MIARFDLSGRRLTRRQGLALTALTSGLLLFILSGSSSQAPTAFAQGNSDSGNNPKRPSPDIILIQVDDMDELSLRFMPSLKRAFENQRGAVKLTNFWIANPKCCPSRAATLTGLYSSTNGLYYNAEDEPYMVNHGGTGGFRFLGWEERSLARHLKTHTDYQTFHIGKYLNRYEDETPRGYVPPFWDHWFGLLGNATEYFYNFEVSDNGTIISHGSDIIDYSTTVFGQNARSTIRATSNLRKKGGYHQPYFMHLNFTAPHVPSTAHPDDADLFPDLRAPRTPSFGEPDSSDKPQWLRNRNWTGSHILQVDRLYRRAAQSLAAVDREIQALADTLLAEDLLSNTIIVFLSDNGLMFGDHRLRTKGCPYNRASRVPLLIFDPRLLTPPRTERTLGSNVDLAPTILDWAGLDLPARKTLGFDGISLRTIIENPDASLERTEIFSEAWTPEPGQSQTCDQSQNPRGPCPVPKYTMLVTNIEGVTWKYIQYKNIFEDTELYNLRTDPDELQNAIHDAPPSFVAKLNERLEAFRDRPKRR